MQDLLKAVEAKRQQKYAIACDVLNKDNKFTPLILSLFVRRGDILVLLSFKTELLPKINILQVAPLML